MRPVTPYASNASASPLGAPILDARTAAWPCERKPGRRNSADRSVGRTTEIPLILQTPALNFLFKKLEVHGGCRQHVSNVAQVLVLPALAKELELANDHVL